MAFLDVNGNGEPKGIIEVAYLKDRGLWHISVKSNDEITMKAHQTNMLLEVQYLCGEYFKAGFDVPFDYVPEDVVEECMLGEL